MTFGFRLTCVAVALALATAACGSRVEPLPQAGGVPGVEAPGTVPGTVPGGGPAGQPGVAGPGGVPAAGPGGGAAQPRRGTGGGPGAAACRSGGATDTGVTATSIKLGSVISITGPLPGQFNAARDAVASYLSMVNESGGVCGRRFQLLIKDDGGDTTNNRNRARELLEEDKVFGFVGSHSANDAGIASVLCPPGKRPIGVPDIGFQLDWAHSECKTSYGVPGQVQRNLIGEGASGSKYLNHANDIKRVAILWVRESEVSILSAWAFEAAMLKTKRDLSICYEQETSVFETGFTQYVLSMKDRCGDPSTTAVYSTMENNNNIRLARAMRDQGYKPKVFAPTFTSYLPSFIRDADGATEGAYMAMPQVPFERCAERNGKPVPPCRHPELQRYVEALGRTFPSSSRPGSFGAPAWGQAALFVEAVRACGAKLTRRCVLEYLDSAPAFTANGLLSPTRPGAHHIYTADVVVQVRNGRFVEVPRPPNHPGPREAPHFWDSSRLFDWWKYYCDPDNKRRFPNTARKDRYIRC